MVTHFLHLDLFDLAYSMLNSPSMAKSLSETLALAELGGGLDSPLTKLLIIFWSSNLSSLKFSMSAVEVIAGLREK